MRMGARRTSSIVALTIVAAACAGKNAGEMAGPADAAAADASGVAPTADAAMSDATLFDATPDATPDAAPDAAPDANLPPRGPLTVHVTEGGGVHVAFIDPDGTLAVEAVTGADGRASGELRPGGSVTVGWPVGLGARLTTVFAVQPGDDLELGWSDRYGPQVGHDTTVHGKTFDDHNQIEVTTHCGWCRIYPSTTTCPLRWYQNCAPPRRDFVALSFDEKHYLALLDQAPADNVVLPTTWHDTSSVAASYAQIPDRVYELDTTRTERLASGLEVQTLGGAMPSNHVATFSMAALGLSDDVWIRTVLKDIPLARVHTIIDHTTPSATIQLDVGATMLPWLNDAAFDLASKTVSWSTDVDAPADAVITNVEFSRLVGNSSRFFYWRAIAPASMHALTIPPLPPSLAVYEPNQDDFQMHVDNVTLVEASQRDYDALRSTIDNQSVSSFEQAVGERVRTSSLTCSSSGC
jgi:hypothetical protein